MRRAWAGALVVAGALGIPGAASAAVVISEVAPQGSSSGEFIELANDGVRDVDVSGFTVGDCAQVSTTVAPGTTLRGKQRLLLTGTSYEGPAADGDTGGIDIGPSLGAVVVKNPAGQVADALAWGTTSAPTCGEGPLAPPIPTGSSLQRKASGNALQDTGSNVADFVTAAPTPVNRMGSDPGADTDGDGVANAFEPAACVTLPDGASANGCPPDPDGDGVYGSADACPNQAAATANGCPVAATPPVTTTTPPPPPVVPSPPAIAAPPADPVVVTDPVLGDPTPQQGVPTTLRFTATNPDAGFLGVTYTLGEDRGRSGLSACRLPASPLTNQPTTFSLPVVFRQAGAHVVVIRVITGACLRPRIVERRVTVDVAPSGAGSRAAGLRMQATPKPAATPCTGAVGAFRSTARGRTASTRALLCLINAERRKVGAPALRLAPRLRTMATSHTSDMIRRRFFAHAGPGGPSFAARFKQFKLTGAAGENLAYGGPASPTTIVGLWLGSPPHRATMLDKTFRYVGFGLASKLPDGTKAAGATVTGIFSTRPR